ncbi:RNA-processing protein [Candidatus Woesearchaeota archaeon]|nr:RNA-processing protein [Candidatus Woesearchaeota archaeon]
MTDYSYEIKIPKERVAVLIGTKGAFKKHLEDTTGTKLDIDSKEGNVVVSGSDAVTLFATRELIKAVGRGFNPELAMQLLKQDSLFELLDINEYARTKNDSIRLKGRVIGNEGKSRKVIENLTECSISVYGKTIGIIGKIEMVPIAKKAIESLLTGSPHASVYSWLERKRREVTRAELSEKDDLRNIVKEEYLDDLKELENEDN